MAQLVDLWSVVDDYGSVKATRVLKADAIAYALSLGQEWLAARHAEGYDQTSIRQSDEGGGIMYHAKAWNASKPEDQFSAATFFRVQALSWEKP